MTKKSKNNLKLFDRQRNNTFYSITKYNIII